MRAALVTLAAIAAVFVVPVTYFAWVIGSSASGEPPLQAIPIGADACRSLVAVQATAEEFEHAWFVASDRSEPWSQSRTKIVTALARLEAGIQGAAPKVPMEIAQRFDALAANAQTGRDLFSRTKRYEDIPSEAWRLLGRSERTYGEVATLVGESCGSIRVAALHERGSGRDQDPRLAREFAHLEDWICPQAPAAPGCPAPSATAAPPG